jgi:hypothetical protein
MLDEESYLKENASNTSVLNASLYDSNNEKNINNDYSDSCSNSSFDIPQCFKKTIFLKEEKESKDFGISDFKCFQIKNKENKDIKLKRSKTDYTPKFSLNNAPKIKPKNFDNELISPLNLCIKTFFQDYSCNKRVNSVLYDFQKNLIDCKSCNDSFNEDDLLSDDTERTTPNANDLNNFSICRKKMKNIINSSNIKSSYEYENILNSDSFFQSDSEISNNNNINKKNNFWHKHIFKQKLKSKEKNIFINKNKEISFNKSKTFDFNEKKNIDTQGLFILGVLESAAKEKKKRKTIGIN